MGSGGSKHGHSEQHTSACTKPLPAMQQLHGMHSG